MPAQPLPFQLKAPAGHKYIAALPVQILTMVNFYRFVRRMPQPVTVKIQPLPVQLAQRQDVAHQQKQKYRQRHHAGMHQRG